jgi:hypothetical protein
MVLAYPMNVPSVRNLDPACDNTERWWEVIRSLRTSLIVSIPSFTNANYLPKTSDSPYGRTIVTISPERIDNLRCKITCLYFKLIRRNVN